MSRASTLGQEVQDLAQALFDSDDVLLQLRKVQAVITHLETFPRQRARAAAKRALFYGCIDYRSIKNILKQGLDLLPLEEKSTRAWSRGSRFARTPNVTLFSNQEPAHAHH
jgi:hypothetical protein